VRRSKTGQAMSALGQKRILRQNADKEMAGCGPANMQEMPMK
jgi:hypothetical protein